MLTCVTLTGADDSVEPSALVGLSGEFPFVEWGILVGSEVRPRFPSSDWLGRLFGEVAKAHPHYVALSLHVCGAPLRSILDHGVLPPRDGLDILEFRRMQLNLGKNSAEDGRDHVKVMDCIAGMAEANCVQELIIQLSGRANERLLSSLRARGINASALYDASGGTGVMPETWQQVPRRAGYAGGLGPLNIAEQLLAIKRASGGKSFWIDMETHIRSDDGSTFDLQKCRRVLDICGTEMRSACSLT